MGARALGVFANGGAVVVLMGQWVAKGRELCSFLGFIYLMLFKVKKVQHSNDNL